MKKDCKIILQKASSKSCKWEIDEFLKCPERVCHFNSLGIINHHYQFDEQ